jgi:hypothetical protein
MTDLSDVNMEGVKPMSEAQELGVGKYLVRIEDTEKKETKEKYDDNNQKLPPNHYLQISMKVYGGPSDGHTEFARLNLWNTNQTAVNMAKSELKSIQEATSVVSTNSDHLHGHWLVLEVEAGKKDPTKTYKRYHALTTDEKISIAEIVKNAPPIPPKAPSEAAKPAAAPLAASSASAPSAGALPSWAKK